MLHANGSNNSTKAKHKLIEEYAKNNSKTIKEVPEKQIKALWKGVLTLRTRSLPNPQT